MGQSDNPSQSLTSGRRLFKLVESIGANQPIGVTDLSRSAGLPKSTTQVYLNTLREVGFVVREAEGYRLSLRFFEQGMNALRHFTIYPVAKPKVYELAEETGELVAAFVEEDGRAVYAVAAGGINAISTDLNIGTRTRLHTTAGGKAILAHLPQEDIDAIISRHGLHAQTNSTITESQALETELAEIRERGVAYNKEEHIGGMHAVAAPVRHGESVLGSLSIGGPSNRLVGSRLEELASLVKGTANEIELNLEYDETVY